MSTSALGLLARLLLSLGVVLALMWLAARMVRGTLAGRSGGTIEVLARQQLGRGAALTVVRIADRALVIGVTEHSVSLLSETDLEAVVGEVPGGELESTALRVRLDKSGPSPLNGSVLSPQTWRRSLDVLRERTTRR